MPLGYLWMVALMSWGVVCALTRWHRLGSFSAIPALLANELPFIVGYLLVASTVLALVDGDLDSAGGVASAVVALLALIGLMVIVGRALRAHAALRNAGKPGRPWGRILRAPFFPGRLTWSGCAVVPTAMGRAARWTFTTAVTGRPAHLSCCTSMAAVSIPAAKPAKRGR